MLYKIGNIIDCEEHVIVHQVNCQNAMGAGVARALYTKWPQVKIKYHKQFHIYKPEELLGRIDFINDYDKIICNAFTQFDCGPGDKLYTNYNAIIKAFTTLKHYIHIFTVNTLSKKIAIPYLYGCGLGGGDWKIVHSIIDGIFHDDVVAYSLDAIGKIK
ncbi:MAG: macro domain-containing protein [Bacilli bacterium]|nr:macro domain-containing protein [Bacilli bacterium]